jgi:alkylation response protein AidB-like acyl-CoA dehydrogenase
MDLLPTAEQQQIIDSTSAYLEGRLPLRRLHGKNGPADELTDHQWRELAAMGWLAMALPEEAGGVGCTAVEEMLVFWQLGRVLAPPVVMLTAIGARVAQAAGQHELAAEIASGAHRIGLAVQDDFAADVDALTSRRVFEAKGATLALVVDGARARLLDMKGVNLDWRPCLDQSVSMGVADLSRCRVVADVHDDAILTNATLLCAALSVGAAETSTRMIVEYAKIRETFGRPIGAYQAVRHPCAEMAARAELAKAQLFAAAIMIADRRGEAGVHAASARVLGDHAALLNADNAIQLHGGIGVTEEFDTHFFIKRANTMASWFGDRRQHLREIAATPLATFAES